MARYVITGGSGFIGHALCRRLAANGARLEVLSRDPARAARALPAGTRVVRRLDELARDEPLDAVINLAGEPIADARWSAARKQRLRDSRIALTDGLVDWMKGLSARPRVLLSASAVGFYGDQGDTIVRENGPAHPEFTHELCSRWEQSAQSARGLGVRVAIVRIGLVLGPGGGFLQRLLPAFRLGLGGPVGNGRQWMSWIHRDDLLALFDWLLARDELDGAFNATAPNPVTSREFARTLGRVLHRPAVLPLPAFALRAAFGEMSRLLLTGQRALPARAIDSGFTFRFPDLESALRDAL
ncbi:MAG: Epimerase family protein [Pseudomonadales bacterium]|nr:Epimerase family protein [Pseudomonadales bacterium]